MAARCYLTSDLWSYALTFRGASNETLQTNASTDHGLEECLSHDRSISRAGMSMIEREVRVDNIGAQRLKDIRRIVLRS
jgi:hypothetical protein